MRDSTLRALQTAADRMGANNWRRFVEAGGTPPKRGRTGKFMPSLTQREVIDAMQWDDDDAAVALLWRSDVWKERYGRN